MFISVDWYVAIYQWQARIHIGRWSDRLEWQNAINKKAHDWLKHSPTVKTTDNNRLILYDILKGQYHNKTIQSWQDAGLLFGLDKKEAEWYVSQKINQKDGDWIQTPQHIDIALLAYVLKTYNVLPEKAQKSTIDLLLKLKSNQKTIPYRATLPTVRFVDTLGMVCPYLAICGEIQLAKKQFEEYDIAKLPDSSIPSHAFLITYSMPMGIYDWSRGIGWYILGLIETSCITNYENRIITLANELLCYQRNDGGFNAMFFNETAQYESSGTVLIGLLMIKAYQINNDKKYLNAAFKIERRLMRATRRTGEIDYCQGDTKGIGYYSHTFSVMPFAQGLALKLSKELNKYENR